MRQDGPHPVTATGRGRRSLGVSLLVALLLSASAASISAPVQVRCRTAFDADYFYFAAEVDKDQLRGSVTAPFGDPRKDDSVGVFLAADPGESSEPNADRRAEMVVSVAQGAQLYRGSSRTPLSGVEDFRTAPDGSRLLFKYRLRARGPVAAEPSAQPWRSDTGQRNGFAVEMAIPWAELGGPPVTGTRMRFNVAVFDTAEGQAPVVSFAPSVKSLEEVDDPRKWSEIVFSDAPVASIAGAPGAIVCSRVFNVKPVIDGAVSEGEWSRVTAFTFTGDSATRTIGAGTVAAARSRAQVELRAPTSPGRVVPHPSGRREPDASSDLPDLVTQPWPKLVYALYRTDYQCDPRKGVPARSVSTPDGQTLIATHPMDGTGPWFTFDRADWHRIQLARMREAGIDVAAFIYKPSRETRLAATAMASALQAMDAAGMDHPMACLWLDASGLDAHSGSGAAIYAAIRTFHECVPERYRVSVPLSKVNGEGAAAVVVIAGLKAADSLTFAKEVRRLFVESFRQKVVLLAADRPLPGFDGVVPSAVPSPDDRSAEPVGIVRAVSIPAGSLDIRPGEHPLSRRTASTYRAAWRRTVSQPPDWVFVHTWNDHVAGSEITPTLEYGLEYLDITRASTLRFRGARPFAGQLIANNAPATAAAGASFTIRVKLRNTGGAAWLPGEVAVRTSWRGSSGSATTTGLTSVPSPVAFGQTVTMALRVPMPTALGVHDLDLQLVRLDRKGLPRPPSADTAAPLGVQAVKIVSRDALPHAATLVRASTPRAVEAQSTYSITVTMRNDGSETWPNGSARIHARLFTEAPGLMPAQPVNAEMADASAALGEDVPPGSEVTVTIPVTFAHADGAPFRFSTEASERYLLRWDVDLAGPEPLTLATLWREIEIIEADLGAQFFNDYTPGRLPGDRRMPVPIGVRNRGPQTWLRDQVSVGYHWYFQDGVEAVWEDEVFPLKVDVPPGAEIGDVGAWVTPPPFDGTYWLVWDLRAGDTWGSTLPTARAYETRVTLVEVVGGRLRFVDMKTAADVRASAPSDGPSSADFNGKGQAFAAELTPPYATNTPVCATLWMPETRTGAERSRKLSFKWPASDGANAVRCRGQQITVAAPRQAPVARLVHILAAAVTPERSMGITLGFSDGSEQFTSFPVSVWTGPAAHGESIAHAMPYSRMAADAEPGPGVSVFRYTIKVKEPKPLTKITLSESPDVRVMAISVER